jgi:hypothetical protein
LKQWKDSLPEIPEIDFDREPQQSFKEIKDLPIRYWRKILENEKLWKEGIITAIFRKGDTLRMVLDYFQIQSDRPYRELIELLKISLEKYYYE